MTPEEETVILVNAYLDGELSPSETLDIERRLAGDAGLRALYEDMRIVSARVTSALSQVAVPAGLADRIMAQATAGAASVPSGVPSGPPARTARRFGALPQWSRLAACLVIGLGLGAALGRNVPSLSGPPPSSITDLVVAGHLRGLAAPQPFDIASSDRHVVKPWFNGRTTIAPSAPDLSAAGFPLLGGRVDVVGDMTVPTLVYQCRRHIISVTVLPAADSPLPPEERRNGTTIRRWQIGNLTYMAVSDLNATDLQKFVDLFIRAAR